jgi:hypothetical protein
LSQVAGRVEADFPRSSPLSAHFVAFGWRGGERLPRVAPSKRRKTQRSPKMSERDDGPIGGIVCAMLVLIVLIVIA